MNVEERLWSNPNVPREHCVICDKLELTQDMSQSNEEQFVCLNCEKDHLSKYDGSLDQKIEAFYDENVNFYKKEA